MGDEAWSARRIGEFATRSKIINTDGTQLPPLSITKDRGVVLQSEKYKKQIATDLRKYVIARRGQFAFDPMSLYYGAIGRVASMEIGLVSPDYVVFDVDDTVDKTFLNYLLRSPRQVAEYEAVAETGNSFGKRRRVYWSVLEQMAVQVPPLDEQRRIAAILSTVDEAIEASQAVIDQLQVVKKAMMAELLTRGLPGRHTRFKQTNIGDVPETWDVVPLSLACEFLDGKRVPIKSTERKPGPYPYYGASGVIDWVDGYLFDDILVLLAEDGANILSRTLPIALKVSGRCWVNNHAHVLKPRMGTDPDFLVHYLESLDYAEFSTGTAQPKLNQAVCQAIPVILPPPDEQQEIGNAFRVISDRRAAEELQRNAALGLRTALMSSLLTGETRVRPAEATP